MPFKEEKENAFDRTQETTFSELSIVKPPTPIRDEEREPTEVYKLRDSVEHVQFLKREMDIMAETKCGCERFAKILEEFQRTMSNLKQTRRSSVIPENELTALKELVTQLQERLAYHNDEAEKASKLLVSFFSVTKIWAYFLSCAY